MHLVPVIDKKLNNEEIIKYMRDTFDMKYLNSMFYLSYLNKMISRYSKDESKFPYKIKEGNDGELVFEGLSEIINSDLEIKEKFSDDYFKAKFAFELYKYSIEHFEDIYSYEQRKKGSKDDIKNVKLKKEFLKNTELMESMFVKARSKVFESERISKILIEHLKHHDIDSIKLFLSEYSDVDLGWEDENKENSLFYAMKSGNRLIIELIASKMEPDDVNSKNKDGFTPLTLSVKNGLYDSASALLNVKDVDVDIIPPYVSEKNIFIMMFQNFNSKDDSHFTFKKLLFAHKDAQKAVNAQYKEGFETKTTTPFSEAVIKGMERSILNKMLELGVDTSVIMQQEDDYNIISLLASAQNFDVIETIIKDLTKTTKLNNKYCYKVVTALMKELRSVEDREGDHKRLEREIIDLIKSIISNENTDLSYVSEDGYNILHVAVSLSLQDVILDIIDIVNSEKTGQIDFFASTKEAGTIVHMLAAEYIDKQEIPNKALFIDLRANTFIPVFQKIPPQNGVEAINMMDSHGRTMLHLAAERNNKAACKEFLDFGSELSARDVNGRTPMHLAVKSKSMESLKFLMQQIPDSYHFFRNPKKYSILDNDGNDIFMYALDLIQNSQDDIERKQLAEMTEEMVKARIINYNLRNNEGQDAFLLSATCGMKNLCSELMKSPNISFDSDYDGKNALHSAAFSGNLELVKILLEKKHFKDLINDPITSGPCAGYTPILLSVVSGKDELFKFLINEGAHLDQDILFIAANISATNGSVEIFKYCVENGVNPKDCGPLLKDIIQSGNIPLVEYLIDDYGLDVNSKEDWGGFTLNFASVALSDTAFNLEMLRFLFSKGANPSRQKENFGNLPLNNVFRNILSIREKIKNGEIADKDEIEQRKAQLEYAKPVIKVFLEHDADLINHSDGTRYNNIERAILFDDPEILRDMVVNYKARLDLEFRDGSIYNGLTPLGFAMANKKPSASLEILKIISSEEYKQFTEPNLKCFDGAGNSILHMSAKMSKEHLEHIIKNHKKIFLELADKVNNDKENFLHLLVENKDIKHFEKAKLIANILDTLCYDGSSELCNKVLFEQLNGGGVSASDVIFYYDGGLLQAHYQTLPNERKKIEEDKERLGINKLEKDVSVLKEDVLALKAECDSNFAKVFGRLDQFQQKQDQFQERVEKSLEQITRHLFGGSTTEHAPGVSLVGSDSVLFDGADQ